MKLALSDATGKLDHLLLVDVAEMLTAVTSTTYRMPNGTALALPEPLGWDMRIYARAASSPSDLKDDECSLVALPNDSKAIGELGDHFVGPNGKPAGRWFPGFEDHVEDYSTTMAHEAFEMDEDQDCVTCLVTPSGRVLLKELGDPVETLWFEYACKSGRTVRCSNAILPGYFTGQGKFDLMDKLTSREQLWDGGYQIEFDTQSKLWTTTQSGQLRPYRARLVINSVSRCDRLNKKLAFRESALE